MNWAAGSSRACSSGAAVLLHRSERDRDLESLYEAVSREMTEIFYAGFTIRQVTRLEGDLARILRNLEGHEARTPSAGAADPGSGGCEA